MTRGEQGVPGELLIRFLGMLLMSMIALAVPFIALWQWHRRHEMLVSDVLWCSLIGGIVMVGWALS